MPVGRRALVFFAVGCLAGAVLSHGARRFAADKRSEAAANRRSEHPLAMHYEQFGPKYDRETFQMRTRRDCVAGFSYVVRGVRRARMLPDSALRLIASQGGPRMTRPPENWDEISQELWELERDIITAEGQAAACEDALFDAGKADPFDCESLLVRRDGSMLVLRAGASPELDLAMKRLRELNQRRLSLLGRARSLVVPED